MQNWELSLLVRAGAVESDSTSQLASDLAETRLEVTPVLGLVACLVVRQACLLWEAWGPVSQQPARVLRFRTECQLSLVPVLASSSLPFSKPRASQCASMTQRQVP